MADEKTDVENPDHHPTLHELLSYHNFTPEKTNIVVTGIQTNRCVLKGAVHATLFGYNVAIIKEATAGNPVRDNWRTEGKEINAPKAQCTNCNQQELRKWKMDIFTGGRKGGPSTEETYTYLKTAKVSVLDKVSDLHKFLKE